MGFFVEISLYIFLVSVGFVCGWVAREKAAEARVNKYLAAMKDSGEMTTENTIKLDVHVEHAQFYIYDQDSGKFITQVNTKQEMFDYFTKNYPNKNVVMTKEQLALFDTV